ncbi:MBL fold metallo-hydrolase [Butyrivibrio sp. AC2005]|uniref:MBL fold metallo-hydrolase n=1 Tax=Butyrivibrio sp. AC2005 TaxID=1280672 RepID=UPI0018C93EA5|nr:MBL fold metallo-hydrolase [Butyrivibrio sp. AC2005]
MMVSSQTNDVCEFMYAHLYLQFFDKKAQIKSLGSVMLYEVNQGRIGLGQCIDEQLLEMGIKDSDLDAVLVTHLDCDHANGLKQVKNAKKFMVSADEVKFANKITNKVRYYKGWWEGIDLTEFEWNDNQGPVGKSFALMTIGKMRSRGVCKINPLTIAVTVVEDICDTLTEKISDL